MNVKHSFLITLALLTTFGVIMSESAEAKVAHHSAHHSVKKHTQRKANSSKEATSGKGVGSGKASIYSDRFNGKKTATGERFHQSNLTAASPTLPLGSKVKVTNKKTGKSVVVKVNDRQAKGGGRVLDLSESAAHSIGAKDGVVPVTTKVIGK